MNKAEFKAFNALERFNVMSSTPGSGLETKRFSYWVAPVAMVRTVELSRKREEGSRDLVAREETRSGAFKSENEDLRDMSPDKCGGIASGLACRNEDRQSAAKTCFRPDFPTHSNLAAFL
jgi:hypothetical protein